MSKTIICSSSSSSNEFLLESDTTHCKRVADDANEEEAMYSNRDVDADTSRSNVTATESALYHSSKFNSLQESNLDDEESVDDFVQEEPSSASAIDQMQASPRNTFFAESSFATHPSVSTFPFPPAHKNCCKSLKDVRKTSVSKSVISPVQTKDECTILPGDNTTVSKVTEPNSTQNKDFLQRDEEMIIACDKTISRKSSSSLYYYETEKMYHIGEDTLERPRSYFNSPNQLNSISFDEEALIHEFELQSLEERMSVSECLGSEYEYSSFGRSTLLAGSATDSDRNAAERIETFKFPNTKSCPPHTICSRTSPNRISLSEEVLCKENILYSDSSDFPETPSTIKADFSVPDNLKLDSEWLLVDAVKGNVKESVLLNVNEDEDQFKTISHAYSDPALTLSDTTDCETLRKVKSTEKEQKSQFPAAQDLVPSLISLEKVQWMSSSLSGSEKTPSSEHNVLTNGMTYVELETSSGGFLHMETDASSSQLTYTEADVSSKALKVSDQDFSSSSLPYTEADVSSIEFPCTEQDIESSVMFTDADTSSNGLPYNEPDDTGSGWPQVEVDTNSTSKLHNEIDTSSYGISSNEFDASSSVFDSSSSGLPYIECESTNRLSYRTLQSCSSGHDVDSLSAGSSGIEGEEKSAPEPLPQLPVSTNEAPCKDQLKCFPF